MISPPLVNRWWRGARIPRPGFSMASVSLTASNFWTPVHEAGHAVISRVLGLVSGSVTIQPNVAEGEAGHAITFDRWQTIDAWEERGKYRDISSAVRAQIIAVMAGAEAEFIILGRTATGDSDDRYHIALMADSSDSGFTPATWAVYEPRLRRQAQRLVRKHRNRIQRVANALVERETLQATEVDVLV